MTIDKLVGEIKAVADRVTTKAVVDAERAVIEAAKAAELEGVLCCCGRADCLECDIAKAVRTLLALEG